jgi:cyclopropane fatty-acyl-phospholipid synthase-like methyltransferase
VLDFGSGVGRLAIPFSRHAHRVVGIDISQSMIAEAARNCESSNVNNVAFKLSDDQLSEVLDRFDLVHSYIVLQHIDWIRGRRILQSLAERVTSGGYLAVQLLTSCKAPRVVRALVRLRYMCPPANWTRNIMRRRPVFEPAMQLHVYDLAKTIEDLKARNFHDFVQLTEASDDQPDFTSTFLFARRESV